MKQEKKVSENKEFFNKQTETDKVLVVLFDYPNITKKNIINYCYGISSVSSVSSVSLKKNRGEETKQTNKTNKTNKTNTNLSNIINKFDQYINRLIHDNLILADKSKREHKYSLTEQGRNQVLTLVLEFEEQQQQQQQRQQKKESVQDLLTQVQNYINQNYIKAIINENVRKGYSFFEIDFTDLSKYNPGMTDKLISEPQEIIALFKARINEFLEDDPIKKILVKNCPGDLVKLITKIRTKHKDKLITLVGEVRNRSGSLVQVLSTTFECPSCGNIITVLKIEKKVRQPSSCHCGRKGKWKKTSSDTDDLLKITLIDLYENLKGDEVPGEINIYLEGDYFDFARINEGERIKIHGIIKHENISKGREQDQDILIPILYSLGIEKLKKDYTKVYINPSDEELFNEIKKDPFKFHSDKLFSDLNDIDIQAKIATLANYGDMHILYTGHPGTGKSQIMHRFSIVNLRGKYVFIPNTKAPGIIGAVTQNKFTGKWTTDGGILRRMHPKGMVVLDELNRDKNNEIQDVLFDIMSFKKIRVNKANVDLSSDCDISIWATVNPVNIQYDYYKTELQNFNISAPLWDRFDLIVYFNNKFDTSNQSEVIDLLKKNVDSFSLPSDKLELLKKYQIKAQLINFKFTDNDYKQLGLIIKEFHSQIDPSGSYRILSKMKKFIEAICRLHHREQTIKKDYVLMTDLLNKIILERQTFLGNSEVTEPKIITDQEPPQHPEITIEEKIEPEEEAPKGDDTIKPSDAEAPKGDEAPSEEELSKEETKTIYDYVINSLEEHEGSIKHSEMSCVPYFIKKYSGTKEEAHELFNNVLVELHKRGNIFKHPTKEDYIIIN